MMIETMELTNTIGSLAGLLTTLAFIPQVIKTWRTRSTSDISLLMFLLFSSGVLLWLIYGILLHALPIIIANGITLSLSVMILIMKVKDLYVERARQRAAELRSL